MSKLLLNGKKISKHLGRMIFIRQSVPNRHTGILCQFFNNFLSKATVLNAVVHPAQNPGSVRDGLLHADLAAGGAQIGAAHP